MVQSEPLGAYHYCPLRKNAVCKMYTVCNFFISLDNPNPQERFWHGSNYLGYGSRWNRLNELEILAALHFRYFRTKKVAA